MSLHNALPIRFLPLAAAAALLTAAPAHADTGKLLLTGGVSSVEGAAGGGISPWAVIGSQATEGEVGVSAYASRAVTRDHGLSAYGVAVGIHDRGELAYARVNFDTRAVGAALGLNILLVTGLARAMFSNSRFDDFVGSLLLIGLVNLGYATYSLSLAMRARRPPTLIVLLVIANSLWAAACLRWAVVFAPTASPWGLAHLLGESAFVGGLALLEWRWRARLARPVEAAA